MLFPPLCAIVDATTAARHGWDVPELAEAYLKGCARWLQIRAAGVSSSTFQRWCDRIVGAARRYDATVVVNDRADVARLAGAGRGPCRTTRYIGEDARRQLGARAIVGLSTHTIAELDASRALAVTYVAVGPIYVTTTKMTGYSEAGLGLVRAASDLRPARPVVAIGGITLGRAPEVLRAGASSVAVISDLLRGNDPASRVRAYVTALAPFAK